MTTSLINVRYTRENYGIAPRQFLGELIASQKIMQFYRESQKSWVTPGVDPVRNMDRPHDGPDRRSR